MPRVEECLRNAMTDEAYSYRNKIMRAIDAGMNNPEDKWLGAINEILEFRVDLTQIDNEITELPSPVVAKHLAVMYRQTGEWTDLHFQTEEYVSGDESRDHIVVSLYVE